MNSLILIRGLPGAGKSQLAETLAEGRFPVFSVDSYFTDPVSGVYEFRFKDNHLAYSECARNTENALHEGIRKVFVDNTFTMEWELEPYFEMAARYNYRVFVITVENRHRGRNTHGISEEQIQKMASKYKVQLM
jgi:predicted kinase